MNTNTIKRRIVNKHDTAENWAKAINFVPLNAELIIYDPDEEYNYSRFKIGNGVTPVNDLPFAQSQADYNQNDSTKLDYIKNRTHYDKWVAFEEILDSFYYFSKNDDGSWSANSDVQLQNNMKLGETYKFISDLVTMEITLTKENWENNNSWFKAYSKDGKAELWLTGILIETEEDVEYFGYPIGTFHDVQVLIYYDSAIGEPIFGVPMEDIPWESDGWTGECYLYECDINVEHFKTQKIDYRYLPEDIATINDIPEIPENLESANNKIQSLNDLTEDGATQYPSGALFIEKYIETDTRLASAENFILGNEPVIRSSLDRIITLEENQIIVDETYSSVSDNAQSGRAVAEAVSGSVGAFIEDDVFILGNHSANITKFQDFELVDANTLTEDVVSITPTINKEYKEIYWVFDIPPMNEIDTTDKGRLYLFPVANKTTTNGGAKLIQQGNIIMSNPANEWKLMIRSEVCGNYARTELWYDDNTVITSGSYGRIPDLNRQSGIVSPYTLVTNPYIDGLTLIMTSSNGGRVFPAGTKYELWGRR